MNGEETPGTGEQTVDRLAIDAGGTWLVTTESGSRYLLDLDAMTALRLAREEPLLDQLLEPEQRVVSVPMRKDAETLPLLGFVDDAIAVGQPAYLAIGGVTSRLGYLSTLRATTPVVEICRMATSGGDD